MAFAFGSADDRASFASLFEKEFIKQKSNYPEEPNLAVTFSKTSPCDNIVDASTTKTIFELADQIPHGVRTKLPDGSAESSSNFATLHYDSAKKEVKLHNFARSADHNCLKEQQQEFDVLGDKFKFVNIPNQVPFPLWQPNFESPFLGVIKEAHTEAFPNHNVIPRKKNIKISSKVISFYLFSILVLLCELGKATGLCNSCWAGMCCNHGYPSNHGFNVHRASYFGY